MSIRVDSSSLIAGAVVVGVPGLGVLAEAVPSTGEHGAGYLYESLEFPADAGKEVRGLITTWPTLGTLTAFEDSSFEYDGPSDSFAFQLYVDGVAVGTPQTVTITVGAQVSITSDVNSSYLVRDITQKDTSDDYAVRSSILQDVEDDYTVFNFIQNDVTSTYSVRQKVEKDVVSSYAVDAAVGVVSNEISSEYLIRITTFEDVVGSFSVLGVVSSSVTSSYEVVSASTVSATASGSYVIRNSIISSNENTYFVRDVIAASSEGSYAVREVISQDSDDSFFVRSVASQVAEDDYFVVGPVVNDISSSYDVLSDKTPVDSSVASGYVVFNSVSGGVISYYNVFGGFAVVKRYNVTLNKENVFNTTLQ